MTTRVVMLVRNSAVHDTRVRKEAAVLSEAGYAVTVVGTKEDGVPDEESVGGVRFLRIDVPPATLYTARDRYLERQHRDRDRYLEFVEASTRAVDHRRDRYLEAADFRAQRYGERRSAIAGWEASTRVERLVRRRTLRPILRAQRALYLARHAAHRLPFRARGLTSKVARKLRRGAYRRRHAARQRAYGARSAALQRLGPVWYFRDYVTAVRHVLDDLRPDVVHAHDLNTLPAAVDYARRAGARVVYDSHELEIHRNIVWTPLKRTVWKRTERRNIAHCDAVITVSPGIAAFLENRYRIPRPAVVLNSPTLDREDVPGPTLHEMIGLDSGTPVFVYVGKVAAGRGVEMLVEALAAMDPGVHLAVLGPRSEVSDEPLLEQADALGVANRFHLLDPVAPETVPSAVRSAFASVNASANVCLSYDLALPNKLFDTVMAGAASAVARLSEMARFVVDHELGVVFDETDPAAIASALEGLIGHTPPGIADSARLRRLQEEVCWERQAEVLLGVYDRLGASPTEPGGV